MNCKLFPNPDNNEWINLYNDLVVELKSKEDYYKEYKKTQPKRNDKDKNYSKDNVGIHHIIPKKIDPTLAKDKENLLYVPFDKHILLHYYLWKSDYKYAPHFKFIAAAARAWNICELPGGEETWIRLNKDCGRLRKEKSSKEHGFEMANLLPNKTGLNYQVWYSAKYPGHKPRIKVDLPDGKSVYIQIENHETKGDVNKISSKELNKIFNWIDLNKEALLKYWNEALDGKIDTVEMSKILKKV